MMYTMSKKVNGKRWLGVPYQVVDVVNYNRVGRTIMQQFFCYLSHLT